MSDSAPIQAAMVAAPVDIGAAVAVLASQMGEIKTALAHNSRDFNSRLEEHGQRITMLEEQRIRADEREKTRLEVIAQREEIRRDRVSLSLTRRQMLLSLLMLLVMFAGVIVAVVEALHHT